MMLRLRRAKNLDLRLQVRDPSVTISLSFSPSQHPRLHFSCVMRRFCVQCLATLAWLLFGLYMIVWWHDDASPAKAWLATSLLHPSLLPLHRPHSPFDTHTHSTHTHTMIQTLLEAAYFAVKPPERVARKNKVLTNVQKYIRYLLFEKLDTPGANGKYMRTYMRRSNQKSIVFNVILHHFPTSNDKFMRTCRIWQPYLPLALYHITSHHAPSSFLTSLC